MQIPLSVTANVDDPTLVRAFEVDMLEELSPLVDEWGFHAGQLTPNFSRNGLVTPVTAEALDAAKALQKLQLWDYRLLVGIGAIKSWDINGEHHRDWMRLLLKNIRKMGYTRPPTLSLDEPFTWAVPGLYTQGHPQGYTTDGTPIPATLQSTAERTATFIREARGAGVETIALCEAIPNHEPWELQAFVEAIVGLGERVDRFTFDLLPEDRNYDVLRPGAVQAIRRAAAGMRAAGVKEIEFIIQPAGELHSQEDFSRSMLRVAEYWRDFFGAAPEGIIDREAVILWHVETGANDEQVLREKPSLLPFHSSDVTTAYSKYSLLETVEAILDANNQV